jgi:hypothetical protein
MALTMRPRQEKRAFTADEDTRLTDLVKELGDRAWNEIEKRMPGRSCRQCRERWNLYLSPTVSNDPWTPEEDAQLMQLYQGYGPRWTVIANHFPKRTPNNIKNRQKQLQRRSQRIARLTPAQITTFLPRTVQNHTKNGIVIPRSQIPDGTPTPADGKWDGTK